VLTGATVTLAAANVTDAGSTITGVTFYRESTGLYGMPTDIRVVGSATLNGSTWSLSTSTTGLNTGTYIYLAVATDAARATSAATSASLKVTAPAPANDNFANATVLTGTSISVTGTNIGATKQPGEPNLAGNRGGASVWYSWTAPGSGTVSLNTHGSNFDTLLGVYTGTSVSSLTLVAGNDDDRANRTLTSAVTFTAAAGTTYHFAIDGYNGATGSIVLNLTEAAGNSARSNLTCSNDDTQPEYLGGYLVTGRDADNLVQITDSRGVATWYTWSLGANGTITLTAHAN
jgi:hypothetical protein